MDPRSTWNDQRLPEMMERRHGEPNTAIDRPGAQRRPEWLLSDERERAWQTDDAGSQRADGNDAMFHDDGIRVYPCPEGSGDELPRNPPPQQDTQDTVLPRQPYIRIERIEGLELYDDLKRHVESVSGGRQAELRPEAPTQAPDDPPPPYRSEVPVPPPPTAVSSGSTNVTKSTSNKSKPVASDRARRCLEYFAVAQPRVRRRKHRQIGGTSK